MPATRLSGAKSVPPGATFPINMQVRGPFVGRPGIESSPPGFSVISRRPETVNLERGGEQPGGIQLTLKAPKEPGVYQLRTEPAGATHKIRVQKKKRDLPDPQMTQKSVLGTARRSRLSLRRQKSTRDRKEAIEKGEKLKDKDKGRNQDKYKGPIGIPVGPPVGPNGPESSPVPAKPVKALSGNQEMSMKTTNQNEERNSNPVTSLIDRVITAVLGVFR